MRAVIYVRVSTEKQEVENQLKQLRTYCKKMEYDVTNEYIDVVSGASDNRPAYNQMFKDASKRLFDVLVFWDVSRFSRQGTLYTLKKLNQLEEWGIKWDSYNEPYFRSMGAFKDVVLSVMTTLAKVEREKISERTKAGLERAVADGKRLGRPKGSKDRKPRRRAGYYDNVNWTGQKKG